MGLDVYAVLVHIVFCVNNIHIVSPSNQLIKLKKSEAFQSVHHVSFILCYTVLYDFVALAFSLIEHIRESSPVTNLVFSIVCEKFDNKI